jgi:AraC-like DNA-binding protein
LQDDAFDAPPTRSGNDFEALLASLAPYLFFKPSPPMPDATFRWRADIVTGSNVSVWRTQYSADWSYTVENSDEDLGVAFLKSGAADMVIGTKHVQRTPATAAIVPLSMLRHHKVTTIDGSYASVMLKFDACVVSKVLSTMFHGSRLSTLDLCPLVDLSTGTGRILHQLARAIASGLHDRQVLMRSPKAMALLTEAALHLIVSNVPHRLIDQLARPADVTPRHIQQAIDYMHGNLYLPLTMVDVANAVGISDRSLQLGFRRFRHTTPAAYLRRIRLDAVHAELSLPENELPVHEVALKWGFTHMGRLAAQYRAVFGVYPSETAKNAVERR